MTRHACRHRDTPNVLIKQRITDRLRLTAARPARLGGIDTADIRYRSEHTRLGWGAIALISRVMSKFPGRHEMPVHIVVQIAFASYVGMMPIDVVCQRANRFKTRMRMLHGHWNLQQRNAC